MKAFEFKLRQRPYSDEEAKQLLGNVIDAETTDWHYNTHHKGYVDKLNEIEKALETADPAKANGNYSEIGELKRRWTWNHAGNILHDIYWENLGGQGDQSQGGELRLCFQRSDLLGFLLARVFGFELAGCLPVFLLRQTVFEQRVGYMHIIRFPMPVFL